MDGAVVRELIGLVRMKERKEKGKRMENEPDGRVLSLSDESSEEQDDTEEKRKEGSEEKKRKEKKKE